MLSRILLFALVVAVAVVIPLVVISTVFVVGEGEPADLLVNTTVGRIRGLRADGFSMYLGIPYAVVNKSNPFGASIPNPTFDGVFNAFDDTALCPQIEEFNNTITGTLDCLHVNVYVPDSASPENKLPVLVWIHGGAYLIGSAGRFLFGPRFIVRHGVILVTVNYRLGPYGFMCLDTPEVPGNEGLKDQLKALRWIKKNIAAFNGNPDKITISGQSYGAMSVDFHLLNADDGLFHKVILQSGTTLIGKAVVDSDRTVPIKIAAAAGLQTNDLDQALGFLKNLDTDEVIKASCEIGLGFKPCVEKEFTDVERYIPENPINVDVPRAKSMPIIIGYNDHEILEPHVKQPDEYFRKLDIFSPSLKRFFDFGEAKDEMALLVKRFYVGDEPLSWDLRWDVIDYDSDLTINYPVHRCVAKYIQNGAMVYHYIFSYSGGRNFAKQKRNITEGSAAHSDELGYLFDISYMTGTPTREDQLIIDRITTLWANFAKYGDPTPETTELLPVKWLPVTSDRMNYLNLTVGTSLATRPFHKRLTFWDLLFKDNMEYLVGYSRT